MKFIPKSEFDHPDYRSLVESEAKDLARLEGLKNNPPLYTGGNGWKSDCEIMREIRNRPDWRDFISQAQEKLKEEFDIDIENLD